MHGRVVVKVGTSSIVSDGGFDEARLAALVDAIADLHQAGYRPVLVASGAIALGAVRLGSASTAGDRRRQLAAAVGQGRLFDAFRSRLEQHGLLAAQFLLTPLDLIGDAHRDSARAALELCLDEGVVPVVNENDALMVRNNDVLAALLGVVLDVKRIVILTDVPGLYDSDPRGNRAARRISVVEVMTTDLERLAGDSWATPGTGGMLSKLCAVWIAALAGVATIIASAAEPGALVCAVRGDRVGTLVCPRLHHRQRDLGRLWRALSAVPGGQLICDSTARQIVAADGPLHSGHVLRTTGSFSAGEVVDVVVDDSLVIARGRSLIGAAELDPDGAPGPIEPSLVLGKEQYISLMED